MEGMPPTAGNCYLFQIPSEILTQIVGYLADSMPDLASLALVNSDCRQLARSCQFRVVTFDGGPWFDSGILALLLCDAYERRQNCEQLGHTRKPSIGACIRRVIINNGGGDREMSDLFWETGHLNQHDQAMIRLKEQHFPTVLLALISSCYGTWNTARIGRHD